ncbi:MAG TPA: DUF692 domain-containing protein [Thermoanaerobaculia bacterium]|nr:DUF692 domain-containing protein [Thermoanaerobaculia bacterium]
MAHQADWISAVPFLGSGLGYRREIRDQIFGARDAIDVLEVIADPYVQSPGRLDELRELCDAFPVIPHGVGLSPGSAQPPDREYLAGIRKVSDITGMPFYSEHLCMTRAPGIDLGHLAPLWYTEEVLADTIRNVEITQDALGKPLVLENITYVLEIPGATLTQTEFFDRLVEATGCGVLLDITNVFINSVNHRFDSDEFLDRMPLQRVVKVHLAGGLWHQGVLVDGHSEVVQEESWTLLEKLVRRTGVKACILEHDANFPESIDVLLRQVARARSILTRQSQAA